MTTHNAQKWLRVTFMAGAVIDAAAMVPMLFPPVAAFFWGFDGFTGIYRYAMGMGAALMLGWTLLLLWAWRKPLERRFVAILTAVVVAGNVAAQIMAVASGVMALGKAAPSFALQAILLFLLIRGYFLAGSSGQREQEKSNS